MSVRVVGRADFEATVSLAEMATQVMDGVGLFCFEPTSESQPTAYRIHRVPRHLGFDQVLYRASQDLAAIRDQPGESMAEPRGPAAQARAALLRVDGGVTDEQAGQS